jgi:NADH-quinone oxidoreductase subunit H
VAVATIRSISLEGGLDRQYLLIGIGVLAVLFLALFFIGEQEEEPEATSAEPVDAHAGGFPVPPMPAGGAVRGAARPLSFPTGSTVAASGEEI